MRKIISVNVGLPREVVWRGKTVLTSIWKSPVAGRVRFAPNNLDGDQQSDLIAHGGPAKAVYVYPSEHYGHWSAELPDVELPWGAFGENFTTGGLLEDRVHIGDQFRIGKAEVVVTQPRMPCFKLGIKFGDPGIVPRFLESRRSGFYLAVLREGRVEAGDPVELLGEDPHFVTVDDVHRLFLGERDEDVLARALKVEVLPEGWKVHLLRQSER